MGAPGEENVQERRIKWFNHAQDRPKSEPVRGEKIRETINIWSELFTKIQKKIRD